MLYEMSPEVTTGQSEAGRVSYVQGAPRGPYGAPRPLLRRTDWGSDPRRGLRHPANSPILKKRTLSVSLRSPFWTTLSSVKPGGGHSPSSPNGLSQHVFPPAVRAPSWHRAPDPARGAGGSRPLPWKPPLPVPVSKWPSVTGGAAPTQPRVCACLGPRRPRWQQAATLTTAAGR